ncbi:MAG: hypothetical protein AAF628_36355 [Planctomycetota bacterium]
MRTVPLLIVVGLGLAAPSVGETASDPPIGGVTQVANGASQEVAYDAATDTYFLVWRRSPLVVGGSREIFAQRIDGTGAQLGSPFLLVANPDVGVPKVASVAARRAFIVVWSTNGTLHAVTVDAASGAMASAMLTVGVNQLYPDVGSAPVGGDRAVVVWRNRRVLQAASLTVDSASSPPRFGTVNSIFGSEGTSWPQVASGGGASGRYLVAWAGNFATSGQPEDVWGVVLDVGGRVVVPRFKVADEAVDEHGPHVDGDGERWVVGYNERGPRFFYHAMCRGVELHAGGSVTVTAPVRLRQGGTVSWYVTDVGWLGRSAVVAYTSSLLNSYVASVDPFSCLNCEGEFVVVGGSERSGPVTVASQHSSDPAAGDDALVAWASSPLGGGTSTVAYQRFRADDGAATDLGGRCGNGGTAHAACARIGHTGFAARLRGSAPSVPAWLLVSGGTPGLPCGTCQFVPDPSRGLVVAADGGGTDALGAADLTLSIPASVAFSGRSFYQQWFVMDGTPGTCLGMSLSNGLRVHID